MTWKQYHGLGTFGIGMDKFKLGVHTLQAFQPLKEETISDVTLNSLILSGARDAGP